MSPPYQQAAVMPTPRWDMTVVARASRGRGLLDADCQGVGHLLAATGGGTHLIDPDQVLAGGRQGALPLTIAIVATDRLGLTGLGAGAKTLKLALLLPPILTVMVWPALATSV